MRKQTKVLVAAAMLTLGASFSALAAEKGTWELEDGNWVCYDEDGDAYEDTWCESNGKEYYMGDDGVMVTSSWVESDDAYYFVGSDGTKTINNWRFVTPMDEEDEDEAWYYFGAKGKMETGKKVIEGTTYYFGDDGKMLTGWVAKDGENYVPAEDTSDSGLVYTSEDGARVKNAWVETYAPGVDPEEDDVDEDDMNWYYIGSKGAPKKGRALDINGETYFFGNDYAMLSGWVATTDGESFESFKGTISSDYTVYFCGNSDQGWAKKNTWLKTWEPEDYEDADDDVSKNWYWIAKNGKVYVPTATDSNALEVDFVDGSLEKWYETGDATLATEKEINDVTYRFNGEGKMLSGLLMIDGQMYYLGGSNDGAMKTGAVVLEDEEGEEYKFFFGKETDEDEGYIKGAGVTGAASGELYINGLLQVADGDYDYEEVEVFENTYFIIDGDGDIKTSKKSYKDDDVEYLNTKEKDFNSKGALKGSYTGTAVSTAN